MRAAGEGDKRMFFLCQTVLRWKKAEAVWRRRQTAPNNRAGNVQRVCRAEESKRLYPFPSCELCWHDALTEDQFVVDQVLLGLRRCTGEDNSRYCRGDLRWLAAYGYTAVQMPFTLVIWLPLLAVHCIITDSDATVCYCMYLRLKGDGRVTAATFSVELYELRKQINTRSVRQQKHCGSACLSSVEQSRRLWLHAVKMWSGRCRPSYRQTQTDMGQIQSSEPKNGASCSSVLINDFSLVIREAAFSN